MLKGGTASTPSRKTLPLKYVSRQSILSQVTDINLFFFLQLLQTAGRISVQNETRKGEIFFCGGVGGVCDFNRPRQNYQKKLKYLFKEKIFMYLFISMYLFIYFEP